MRGLRYLAAAVAITGLLAGPAVTAASAATSQGAAARGVAGVHLRGGTTAVTTAPGVASALLQNGIVPQAIGPGSERVLHGKNGLSVRFAFPVTGGLVTVSPLSGNIYHDGGILFRNTRNGKTIEVSQFTIDLTHGDLTGIVNGNRAVRVPLFRLGLAHARLAVGRYLVTARGIVLTLTWAAAKALNAALGTRLFSPGLELGTARTVLRF
jgi:hypothetical protein